MKDWDFVKTKNKLESIEGIDFSESGLDFISVK